MIGRMASEWKHHFYYNTYFISNDGIVKNRFNRELTQRLNKDGYLFVRLSKHGKRIPIFVHKLVLEAFVLKKPEDMGCNHKDGNKLNNNVDNLEWVTFRENNLHAYKTGLKNNKGENHGRAIRNNKDIIQIRKLWNTKKYTQQKIADIFNTTQSRISEIVLNKSWKHVK